MPTMQTSLGTGVLHRRGFGSADPSAARRPARPHRLRRRARRTHAGPTRADAGLARSRRVSPAHRTAARRSIRRSTRRIRRPTGPEQSRRRRQLRRRIRSVPAGARTTRAGLGPGARQYRRFHTPQRVHPLHLRRDGATGSGQSGVPGASSVRTCRPRTPPTRRSCIVWWPRQDRDGAKTAAALWKSFTEPGHDLRMRAARIAAPVLITWGARISPLRSAGARRCRPRFPVRRSRRCRPDTSCSRPSRRHGWTPSCRSWMPRTGCRNGRTRLVYSAAGRTEAEPGVSITRPAPADLRRVSFGCPSRPVPLLIHTAGVLASRAPEGFRERDPIVMKQSPARARRVAATASADPRSASTACGRHPRSPVTLRRDSSSPWRHHGRGREADTAAHQAARSLDRREFVDVGHVAHHEARLARTLNSGVSRTRGRGGVDDQERARRPGDGQPPHPIGRQTRLSGGHRVRSVARPAQTGSATRW